MTDWTDVAPAPFGVSYFSSYNGIHSIGAATGSFGTPASGGWAVVAHFIPFRLMAPTRITKLWVLNGATVSGNLDLGIYNANAVRLVSTGSTEQNGANAIQIIALAAAIWCDSGLYYMALTPDNTTATFFRVQVILQNSRVLGFAKQTGVFPLPAVATFATVTGTFLPVIGFISEEG